MHARNLKPAQRDVLLGIWDHLAAGTAGLKSRAIVAGYAITISDALFDASASDDKLPALAGEQLMRLFALTDAPTTYGQAARVTLLEFPAVAQRRAEAEEEARWTAMEVQAERNAERAKVKQAQAAEAEAKEKARVKQEKVELARRAKSELKVQGGWKALYQNGRKKAA